MNPMECTVLPLLPTLSRLIITVIISIFPLHVRTHAHTITFRCTMLHSAKPAWFDAARFGRFGKYIKIGTQSQICQKKETPR
uniref:Putative secreted protein n=1 Tax=Anopheles darlingi TaxID=43151 RepID=A0A2M4DFA9_ANODA